MNQTLVFYPDYRGGNPYQTLLYRPATEIGIRVIPGSIDTALAQSDAAVVFHVHWLNALFKDCVSDLDAWQAAATFINSTRRFLDQGGILLWTVHNHGPHEARFVEQHLRVSLFLSAHARRVHLHCSSHIAELGHLLLDHEKIAIHRHGNYIGYYGPFSITDRIDSFAREGYRALFLGMLRAYKGIETLIETVGQLRAAGIPVTIAGKPQDDLVRDRLAPFGDDPGVRLIMRRVSEQEVHELCSESNIGVISYDKILTSGTLKLYLSYGMMIIAPPLPTLIAEDRFGTFFYQHPGQRRIVDSISKLSLEQAHEAITQSYFLAQEARWSASLFQF